jgi:hypothetical protein
MGLLKSFGIALLMFMAVAAFVGTFATICMWLQLHVGVWAAWTFYGSSMLFGFTCIVHSFRKDRR